MKFNFKIQQYQTDAVDSVVGVFRGQPYSDPVNYRRDIGKIKRAFSFSQMSFSQLSFDGEQEVLNLTDDFDDAGFKNEIVALPDTALLSNIREIQQNNNVKLSDKLINNLGRCSLDVEMETGTGKTYVYIKTMYELNKHYGWSKFIVVVPSSAIREGVKKSFEITQLQYTVSKSEQRDVMDAVMVRESNSFYEAKSSTTTLKHSETSQIKYDLVGKIAEGTVLTRKTVATILQGISPIKFAMFKNNPEEFITKVIRLIKEQKATMIVEHISYDQIEGKYDSSIFTAEKHTKFDKAYRAEKHIQDYVFTEGTAENNVERRFAKELDGAKEVCVYAKLPKGFAIPTPVGNYSPDWAIAFYEGTVKHIYFIAETKGTMESMELRPIEEAKISCVRKLFNEISTENVVYHDVDSYQSLLDVMNSIEK